MVRFWVLVGNSLFLSPEIEKDLPLAILFEHLQTDQNRPVKILTKTTIDDCKLYSINPPVSARGKPQTIVEACFDASNNWVQAGETELVEDLVEDDTFLNIRYVCFVIEPPQAKRETALNELKKRKYNALFQSLQITLESFRSWSRNDVLYNLKGGFFWSHGAHRTLTVVTELESSLAEKRGYSDVRVNQSNRGELDLQTAHMYDDDFEKYFASTTTRSYVVKNTREFVAFFAVLRSHEDDATRVSDEPSSAFKANYLSSHYFVPPFFSCPPQSAKTVFKADMPWKFPVMLATREEPFSWCKTKPKSDFSVISSDFLCPFMLCEVISERDEEDRWRMLVQAIVAARVGYYFQKSHTQPMSFFVVAVYLRANLTAERYIVTQTDASGKVSIAQTNFNLLVSDEALDFLREMFNLQGKLEVLLQNMDGAKKGILSAIEQIARDIPSLTSQRDATKRSGTADSMQSIPEESCEHAGGARTPFTDDPEILERLETMGYAFDMVLFGFEHLAMISRKSNERDRGFLKITRRRREVEILQYLARINAPDNHTISGVQIWVHSSKGFVVYMSSGGGHLTALRQPNKHLWSAATQLVEAVAFMHKHGVAHRDIKPANVLIPPGGGRLSIIDFSIAIFVDGPGVKVRDAVGTEDYMAPEVYLGDDYDPVRADLWSCGKTLQQLCCLCGPSMQTVFLVGVCQELMSDDPLQRPTMRDVLNRMATFDSSLSGPCLQMRLSTHLVPAEARS